MGMKKLPKHIKKSKKITVNLTVKQEEELREMALEAESTVSNYIRTLIFSQH